MKPAQWRGWLLLVLVLGAVTALAAAAPLWMGFLAGLWPAETLPARVVGVDYLSPAKYARVGGQLGGRIVVRVEVPKLESWSRAAAATFGELRVGESGACMGVVWGDDGFRLGNGPQPRSTPHAWFELMFSALESDGEPESASTWQRHFEGTAPLAVRVVCSSMLSRIATTEWLDLSPFRTDLAARLRAR